MGVSAENITLSNVPGGAAAHFITAKEIDIGVDFGAVLARRLVIKQIRLEEPNVALEVDRNGQGNWLLRPVQVRAPSSPHQPPATAPHAGDMRIDRAEIANGHISFYDRRTNQAAALDAVNMRTRLEGLDQPAKVDADFTYNREPVTLTATVGSPRAMQAGQQSPLTFETDGRFLTASFDGTVAAATGTLTGQIVAAGPSVRELARWAGFAFPNGQGLERFNISGALGVAPGRYSFSDATIEVDEILARGNFSLDTGRPRPFLSGNLAITRLDLNRYLAPGPEGQTAQAAAAVAMPAALDVAASSWSDAPITLDILRSVDASLELTTGPLTVFRTTLERAVMTTSINEGYLAATLHELALYGGTGTGRFEIDARTSAPRFVQDLSLDGVAVEGLLGDAIGFRQIGGSGQLRLALTAQGQTQRALVASLSGRAALVLNQGSLAGLDIGGLSETIGRIRRNELERADALTRFSALSLSLTLQGGRAATDDFFVTLPAMRVNAVGVIDLNARRLDLRFMPRGRIVTTPFTMRGPFGHYAFESDLRSRTRAEFEGLVRGVQGR